MTQLKIGDKAPDFKLPADGGSTLSLNDFAGRKLLLYFYPKDNTPGCTTQACDLRDNLPEFEKLGVAVVGVSKDSAKKHDGFKAKYNLNFPLVSDEEGTMLDAYGVWKEKSMYGKSFMGIERTTFIIDEDGKIAHIFPKVNVKTHIDDVKTALEKL